jgi:tetratricopeptide (TPR) repeat protein
MTSHAMTRFRLLALAAALLPITALAQEGCGPLENAFGPFDYRTAKASEKQIVERNHFTESVAALRRGTTGALGADIDYTLRAFPNHPRALHAMMKLGEQEKRIKPVGANYTIDCYFERALRWAPDDPNVRMLTGMFLLKQGKRTEAVEQLEEARKMSKDDANVNYNLGLAYFDLKDYDKALEAAHKAYAGGFPLPGLRNKLQAAGKWRAPAPTAAPDETTRVSK